MPLKLQKRSDSPFWWIAGTIGGTRVRESTGTADRDAAEECRAARENAIYRAALHGAPVARATFAVCVLSYLQHAGPHSASTKARISRILAALGPQIMADDIDQAVIDQICLHLLRPNAAPATRLREVTTPIRAILMHASRRKLCSAPSFEVGRASPIRTEWLTPKEAERLINAAAAHLKPLLIFLLCTGARLGEALSLDWKDVDLAHQHALLRDTKAGTHRPVELCPRAVAALAGLNGRDGHVFRTQNGLPYAERKVQGGGQIKTAWRHALQGAGITKPITPHGCRHTWASWHYAEHRDLMRLKVEGGWHSVSMVERYAHLLPAGMVTAIQTTRGTRLTRQLPSIDKKSITS